MTKKPKRKNFSHFICYFYQRRIIESSEKQLVNYPILSVTRIRLNDMRKYFLYACLLFAGVFTACDNDDSDGIDPSIPFYQNLGVEYNVTQNHTHIGANFNKYNSEGADLFTTQQLNSRLIEITAKGPICACRPKAFSLTEKCRTF